MTKLKKILFKNHPVLGDLELDFCDRTGNPVDTIIFAGENGTGKSTILNTLYNLFAGKMMSEATLELLVDGKTERLEFYFKKSNGSDTIWMKNNKGRDILHGSTGWASAYPVPCIFSDVEILFSSPSVQSVTSLELDEKKNSRRSGSGLPKEINQLLIDIEMQDAMDFKHEYEAARKNGENTDVLVTGRRIKRFTKAFEKMFGNNLQYSRVENNNGAKQILFQKGGKDISLAALSSGEKQIVYRGGFLLKDANALNGALVFIDEPEISLHPTWQMKIMDYYKGVFTSMDDVQTSQMFVVTHSPFIIHNGNRKNDKVIVIARNDQGQVVALDKASYYACNGVESIVDAFHIHDFAQDKSYVYLEGRTDELYFRRAVEVFDYTDLSFEFKWIGRVDENGNEKNTGESALTKGIEFLRSRHNSFKTGFLYDSDVKNVSEDEENNVFRRRIEHYPGHPMKKGIENALVLDGIDWSRFYSVHKATGPYGEESSNQKFEKMKFCEHLCACSDEALKLIFANLKTEIEKLKAYFEDNK